MKKQITFEERRRIQLDMLNEIDTFCRDNNIKYILAFGTLLGAIRHNGFIPWDDDVDISMPYEDMLVFKKKFKSNLCRYYDIDTENYYPNAFSGVAHNFSYNKKGLIFNDYGVSIDIYPVIEVSSSQEETQSIIIKGTNILEKRLKYIKWRSRIIRFLPIKTIIGYKRSIRDYYDFTFKILQKKQGGNFHFVAGPLKIYEKETLNFNPFSELIEVTFEGMKYMAPKRYDEYLSKRYGDYMELPPIEERHPYHGGDYYWKD